MSATVTGTFLLLDKASAPLKRIELQARKTDQAMGSLGNTMDNIGTNNQLQGMEDTGRKLRELQRDAKETGDGMKSASRNSDMLTDALDQTGAAAERGGRSMGRMRSKLLLLGGAIGALLPILVDLGGALGALIGSLGQALIGVGALGTALGGTLLVGLAGVAGAGLAAKDRLKELKGEVSDLGKRWKGLTRPGQDDFIGMLEDGLGRLNDKMKVTAASSNRSMAAMRDAMGGFFDRLDVPLFDRFINRMTTGFERISGPLMQSLADIGETLTNIAIASAPFMEQMIYGFREITAGWANSSSDIKSLRSSIGTMVGQASSWVRFMGALWDLTKSVFGSGADEGQGLVDDMTRKMREWERWIDTNKGKMDGFWKSSIMGTKELARFLGAMTVPLKNINDALSPLVFAFEKIVGAMARMTLPGTGISALTAAILGIGASKVVGKIQGSTPFTPMYVAVVNGAKGLFSGRGGGMASPPVGGGVAGGGKQYPKPIGPVTATGAGPAGVAGGFGSKAASVGSKAVGFGARWLAPLAIGMNAFGALSDLQKGDTGGAAATGVGTAAGAGIGAGIGALFGGVGAIPGAAIGAGIGGMVGKPIAGLMGLFGGGDKQGDKQEEKTPLGALVANSRQIMRLRKAEEIATDRVELAERRLRQARRAGVGATIAEARLTAARERSRNVTDALGAAKDLNPIVKGAMRGTLRYEAGNAKTDLAGNQGESAAIVQQIKEAQGRGASPNEIIGLLGNYEEEQKQVRASRKKLTGIITQANAIFGKKYARSLRAQNADALLLGPGLRQAARSGRLDANRRNSPFALPDPAFDAAQAAMGSVLAPPGRRARGAQGEMANVLAPPRPPSFEIKPKVDPAAAKGVETDMGKVRKATQTENRQIQKTNKNSWQAVRNDMVGQIKQAKPELDTAMGAIKASVRTKLADLGFTGSAAGRLMGPPAPNAGGDNPSGGNPRGQGASTGARLLAAGGRIAGIGNQDKVNMGRGNIAAPGELVVNRHTEAAVNRDLMHAGKPPLGRRVAGENRPHYMPPPTKVSTKAERERHSRGGRFAGGGQLIPADGFPGEIWNSKIAGPAKALINKYNLFLTDAYGPGHMSTEHTQLGTAIDVVPGPGGSWGQVGAAVADAVTSGYTPVYYDGSGGSINLPPHGPGHHAHITMLTAAEYGAGAPVGASMGAGSVGSGPPPSIQVDAPKTKLRGIGGKFAQRGSDILALGMQRRVNKRLAQQAGAGPAGPGSPMGASVFGGPNDPTTGTIGYRGDSLPGKMAFAELGMGEAMGGLPYASKARISYGGKSVVASKLDIGLGGGDVDGQARKIDLWHETAAALGFPFGTGIVKVQNMAKGGRMPFGGWFGDGGSFTADQPTLIGVGDGGKEHIQITPQGRGKGPSEGITIGNITIQNHRKGDIQKQLKQEIAAAFNQLTDELQNDAGAGIV